MVNLKFNSIDIKHFLSFDYYQHIFNNGIDLVEGKNGSGKTTLISAILFVLYNKTLKDINKARMMNRNFKKDLLVELDVNINNDNYTIKRGIKPDLFEISKNGIALDDFNNLPDIREKQKIFVDDILQITETEFLLLVFKHKDNTTSFIKMKADEQREFIEKMFNLSVFGKVVEVLKDDIHKLKVNISDVNINKTKYETLIESEKQNILNQTKLLEDARQNKINEINQKIQLVENHFTAMKRNHEKTSEEILLSIKDLSEEKLNKKYENEKFNIKADLDAKIVKYESHKTMYKTSMDDIKKKIKTIEESLVNTGLLESLDKEIKTYTNTIQELNVSLDLVSAAENEAEEILKKVKDLQVTEKDISNNILKIKTTIDSANKHIAKLKEMCDDCIKIPDILKDQGIEEKQSKLVVLAERLKIIKSQIDDKQNELANLGKIISKKSSFTKEINYLEKKIETNKNKKVQYDKDIENNKNLITQCQTQIERDTATLSSFDTNILDDKKTAEKLLLDTEKRRSEELSELLIKKQNIQTKIESLELDYQKLSEKFNDDMNELEAMSNKAYSEKVELNVDKTKLETYITESLGAIEEYNHFNTELKYSDLLKDLINDKGGVKSYIISKYLPYINKTLNTYISKYGLDFAMMFKPDFTIEFKGGIYDDLGFGNLSSGEMKRIDMSILFAFLDFRSMLYSKKISLLVLDEVLHGLDDIGLTTTMEILKFCFVDNNVYIVEHGFKYGDFCDRNIIVSKDGRGNSVVKFK